MSRRRRREGRGVPAFVPEPLALAIQTAPLRRARNPCRDRGRPAYRSQGPGRRRRGRAGGRQRGRRPPQDRRGRRAAGECAGPVALTWRALVAIGRRQARRAHPRRARRSPAVLHRTQFRRTPHRLTEADPQARGKTRVMPEMAHCPCGPGRCRAFRNRTSATGGPSSACAPAVARAPRAAGAVLRVHP